MSKGWGTLIFTTVFLVTASFVFADDQQKAPEYVDPQTGVVNQYGDGYGNFITREQFTTNVQNGARMVEASANRQLLEARQYQKTAQAGEDASITQNTINGLEQSKKDVWTMSNTAIEHARSLKPVTPAAQYEKPKVLVSE